MIITSSSQATLAGEAVLRSGGTAVDAMIAAQAVLGLVRPQDSGLGGGAFVVYYDAATGKTTTFDGRETAPAAATEDRFADMEWVNAWQSGLSVGVPGVPKLMEVMHKKYGKSDWADLFQDAIDLAENGFNFHPSTSIYISTIYETFGFNCSGDDILFLRDPTSKSYFVSTNCTAKETIIYNKDYAETLRSISSGGANAFYTGEIASSIVDAVTNDLNIPGDMTLEDLRNYHVIERPTVCASYRGRSVCGMGPPSSVIDGISVLFLFHECAPAVVRAAGMFRLVPLFFFSFPSCSSSYKSLRT
jgi:gamma-glutamyltranspeptidase/glutathione hydrolase